MSWAEAYALLRVLLQDPTSATYAAMAEWKYPVSHEFRAIADLYDLTASVNSGKRRRPKRYPRPWKEKGKGIKSAAPTMSQAEIRAALAARGH